MPEGVWLQDSALIFYGMWKVDKVSIELTRPFVNVLTEFNPLALEFLNKLAIKMKQRAPKPGKLLLANRKVFEALLRVFEDAYVSKVGDYLELTLLDDGNSLKKSRLRY